MQLWWINTRLNNQFRYPKRVESSSIIITVGSETIKMKNDLNLILFLEADVDHLSATDMG